MLSQKNRSLRSRWVSRGEGGGQGFMKIGNFMIEGILKFIKILRVTNLRYFFAFLYKKFNFTPISYLPTLLQLIIYSHFLKNTLITFQVLVTLCLTSVALSNASYQAYPWGYINMATPKCHTEWETVYTEQCATTYAQVMTLLLTT